jgi:hypothetical protein
MKYTGDELHYTQVYATLHGPRPLSEIHIYMYMTNQRLCTNKNNYNCKFSRQICIACHDVTLDIIARQTIAVRFADVPYKVKSDWLAYIYIYIYLFICTSHCPSRVWHIRECILVRAVRTCIHTQIK